MKIGLIKLLRQESKDTNIQIMAGAVLSGLANGVMVIVINAAAQNYAELNFRYMFLFVICIALYIVSKRYALAKTAVISRNAIFKAHTRMADKIRRSSLVPFEAAGKSSIYGTLSENTEIIFEASRLLVSCSSAAIMLLLSFTYIAFLSAAALWLTVGLMVCAIAVYVHNQRAIMEELRVTLQKENEFLECLNHFLDGFKEVKMNRERSDDLFTNYLEKISVATRQMKIRTDSRFISSHIFTQLIFYILIAFIIFVLPQISSTPPEVIVQIMSVILFTTGPMGILIDGVPIISKASVAVEKIQKLETELDAWDDSRLTVPENPFGESKRVPITLNRVFFQYQDVENKKLFSVGPVDLTIHPGEILFITGGNGSGKTTLIKVIAGLYYPQGGVVSLGGRPVNLSNYEHYRGFFSAIFSDFHLFDRLYGLKDVDEARLHRLLQKMELSEKTDYIQGRFTQMKLSTGQRKRLALVVALMEDRPIYVLDEVAADQDPIFRKYFYEKLLKELKEQGKTLIVISHDDRYFHVADRVLKMEYGKMLTEEEKRP
jgi:putative ATP-binding cassette transporter